ncbi:hypothetical protein [Ancylobacter sp. FA202]|uniref:hypothetical protein n=1 Tax=Ancylobacter sp. FA202 TaxID=1111106 RepID=UPI000371E979|nr:hypothetical protein [Ancylobacter sp. FA202]
MYIHEDYGGPFPPSIVDRLAACRDLSLIIERAMEALDALDPDSDDEPDGDELDQSGPEWSTCAVLAFHVCTSPHEDDEDGGDAEYVLGWREERAGFGLCPTPHDDAEDDGCREPSIASPESYPRGWYGDRTLSPCGFLSRTFGFNGGDQSAWARGCANDREDDAGDDPEDVNEDGGDILDGPHDDDDNGIADAGGRWEQLQRRRGVCHPRT